MPRRHVVSHIALAATLLVSLTNVSDAQSPPAARSVAPFPRVEGTFVALSVPDLPASIAWYIRTFDMKQTFTIPAMGVIAGGALLEGSGFTVELLQHREAKPGSTPAELTHGVAKVGMVVSNFDELLAALRARGAVFFSEPNPARPGQRASVMLKDNAGNMLQILGPLTPR